MCTAHADWCSVACNAEERGACAAYAQKYKRIVHSSTYEESCAIEKSIKRILLSSINVSVQMVRPTATNRSPRASASSEKGVNKSIDKIAKEAEGDVESLVAMKK